MRHDWPFLQFVHNVKASGRDVELGPVDYVLHQAVNTATTLPVWIAGLGWLMLSRRARPFRPLGWAFLVALAVFIVTKGKDYYIAPAFATLFAAGAVAIEGFSVSGARRLLRPAVVTVVLLFVPLLPLTLPLLAVDHLIAFQEWLGCKPPATEKAHARAVLPHVFAWQFGWDEMVAAVSQAYWAMPPEERARVAIIGNDYGQSGAVDLLGPRYGLPMKALGTHQSYWLWGPGEPGKDVFIVLGDRAERLSKWCGDVQVVAELSHPYTAVMGEQARARVPPAPLLAAGDLAEGPELGLVTARCRSDRRGTARNRPHPRPRSLVSPGALSPGCCCTFTSVPEPLFVGPRRGSTPARRRRP